jgi:hypothetical protein
VPSRFCAGPITQADAQTRSCAERCRRYQRRCHGANGPEAGVWVIAETRDLPTRYIKIVVTDDQRALSHPELPKANYDIWVRGYGWWIHQRRNPRRARC